MRDVRQHASATAAMICVVEEPLDVLALERTAGLPGATTCCTGRSRRSRALARRTCKIRELVERVRLGGVREVILATNPSMEGDYTALYLRQQLLPLGVRVTRLARGLPVGGDLEYADQNTLLRALAGRNDM